MPITKLIQAYPNIRAISSYKFLVVKMYSSVNSSERLTLVSYEAVYSTVLSFYLINSLVPG